MYVGRIRSGQGDYMKAFPSTVAGMFAAQVEKDPSLVNAPGFQDQLATLQQGAGVDYAHTRPGFESHETRLGEEAAGKLAETARGHNLTYDASMAGHRITGEVGMDRNRRYSDAQTYRTDQTVAEQKHGHELTYDAAMAGHQGTVNVGMNRNLLAYEATQYKADHPAPKGGAGGSGGKPPSPGKLDKSGTDSLNKLIGALGDMDPGDKTDIQSRATYYMLNGDAETRNNPAAATRRAATDVFGETPKIERSSLPIIGVEYGAGHRVPVAFDDRPDLPPPVANIFAGTPASVVADGVPPAPAANAGVPAPTPAATPAPAPAAQDENITQALAIVKGNPQQREPMIKYLLQNGYSEQQLKDAGI
jgi:hypothetical protein